MKFRKNALEWTVFGVSAVLVIAVVVSLLAIAVRSGDAPPSLAVENGAAERTEHGYRIPITVRNVGDETAAEARIHVELRANDGVRESAEVMIPFVPRRSSKEAWVEFRHDPECCEVAVRTAFNKP